MNLETPFSGPKINKKPQFCLNLDDLEDRTGAGVRLERDD